MSHRATRRSVIAALALALAVAGCAIRPPSPGLTLSLAPGVRMELVRVPAGEFIMGSTAKDVDAAYASCVKAMPNCQRTFFEPEKPQHRVYLDAYLIGKHEVTVAQFAAFVDATRYQTTAEKEGKGWSFTGSQWEEVAGANWRQPQGMPTDLSKLADHPVTQVSWDDAVAFSAWASEVTSRTVRLPTEAEWEKAARGTDGRIYPWGNAMPTGDRMNFADKNLSVDWADQSVDDGYQFTAPVGSYPAGASPYGALDMAGNVWDWVADWFDGSYYAASPAQNPSGASSGEYRVVRGGSWDSLQSDARAVTRFKDHPGNRSHGLGFRVVVAAARIP